MPKEIEFSFTGNEVYRNGLEIGLKQTSADQWEAYPLTVEGICLINVFLNSFLEKEKANKIGIEIESSIPEEDLIADLE